MSVLKTFWPRSTGSGPGALALCLVLCLGLLAAAPARAQLAISTPLLSSAPNFRDLAGISALHGGTGLVNPTGNFGLMRQGVFYRTDELKYLSRADSLIITLLGIRRDIDLRTGSEVASSPDIVPFGVAYTNINIYGTFSPTPLPPFTVSPAVATSFMQASYRAFVTDPVQRAGFRAVLLTLAHDPYADLYHCSGGKDRTGWTSAILQSIAGVGQSTIMRDYLATNSYTSSLISASRAAILAQTPGANPDTVDALLGVQSSYLQAGLDEVIASYGSMYAYLTQGLGLSQADIYVLRAKMVSYAILPGQLTARGNAASGTAFLGALQESPLSGSYTNYNYYLQSAVDQGSLGGVQTQAGGQVHADSAAYLLRQPLRIDDALAPQDVAGGLRPGETRAWLTGFGGNTWTSGKAGMAASREYDAGSLAGVSRRLGDKAFVTFGMGGNWGQVESADASVEITTVLATLGARYAFSSLESGPFAQARLDAGWVDYQSRRGLGGGMSAAVGSATGLVYGGRLGLGYVLRLPVCTVTPQAGVRLAGVTLPRFDETDSELALRMHGMDKTTAGLLADVDIGTEPLALGTWTLAPAISFGYERTLGNPQTDSTATLYGFAVNQKSAYDSVNLYKAGLGLTASRQSLSIKARATGLLGEEAKSAGLGGQVAVSYSF